LVRHAAVTFKFWILTPEFWMLLTKPLHSESLWFRTSGGARCSVFCFDNTHNTGRDNIMKSNRRSSQKGSGLLYAMLILFVFIVLVFTGYFAYNLLTASLDVAHLLPQDTPLYLRLQGVGDLKDRIVQTDHLNDVEQIRGKLDKFYSEIMEEASHDRSLGLDATNLDAFIRNIKTLHAAIVFYDKQEGTRPVRRESSTLVFLEMSCEEIIAKCLKDLGDKAKVKTIREEEVVDLGRKWGTFYVMNKNVVVFGPEELLASVIDANINGRSESLADTDQYCKAYDDLGHEGDLFVFADLSRLRAAQYRMIDSVNVDSVYPGASELSSQEREQLVQQIDRLKERERKNLEETWTLFKNLDCIAGAAGVAGTLTVRVYTIAGKALPEFLVRPAQEKEFLERIPAEAVLTLSMGYQGGKEIRRSFADWIEKDVPENIRESLTPQITGLLPRLEEEVLIIAEDFWACAIPVDTELAFCVAPDEKGRWGMAVFFDYEDREQVETLKKKLFEEGLRKNLPWQKSVDGDLTIHYLDLEKVAAENGEEIPSDISDLIQLQAGYALNDELFVLGTLGTLRFALNPEGKTLADILSYDGVDAENAFLFVFRPGKLIDALGKIESLTGRLPPLVGQIPSEASYLVTLTLEKEQATLRTNIPFFSIGVLAALEEQ